MQNQNERKDYVKSETEEYYFGKGVLDAFGWFSLANYQDIELLLDRYGELIPVDDLFERLILPLIKLSDFMRTDNDLPLSQKPKSIAQNYLEGFMDGLQEFCEDLEY